MIALSSHTDSTTRLAQIAVWTLGTIYQPGYNYSKAGVMLGEIVPAAGVQGDMFGNTIPNAKSDSLMEVMDRINTKMGKGTLIVGSQGYGQPWAMRQQSKSQAYTTNWNELLTVD
jgi:DNA polymerase V